MSETSTEKVLFVDDERNVLDAYRRNLGQKYKMQIALGGEEALQIMANDGPYAVVVTDLRMDGMDGVKFLTQARWLSPDSVRIMLTGADHHVAVEAVNEGNIFRFLSKPCPTETLDLALQAALAQYRLVTAERALLSSTLTGAVKILTDVLAAVRPVAFGRTNRVRDVVRQLAKELVPDCLWRAELAALLSQVGCVAIPEEILAKAYAGKWLPAHEAKLFEEHPRAGHNLVAHVSRLQQVAEIILQQEKRFDGSGFPYDGVAGKDIPMEARILKVALDLDSLMHNGLSESEALTQMSARKGAYDKEVLDVIRKRMALEAAHTILAGADA